MSIVVNKKFVEYVVICLAISMCLLFPAHTYAKNNVASGSNFIISWHANTSVPNIFMGKALPVAGSSVDVYLSSIVGGRLNQLKQREIRWYFNQNLINKGDGLNSIKISLPSYYSNSYINGRVSVEQIDGKNSHFKDYYFTIPVFIPKLVLSNQFGNLYKLSSNRTYTIYAIPYFFSIKDIDKLNVLWMVNDNIIDNGTNKWVLNINTQNNIINRKVKITAQVTDKFNVFESASASYILSTQ